MKRKVIIFAVVFSVFLFASCDNDASGPEPVAVAEVILSLDNLVIEPDESATLTAAVLPADAANKAVTWTSSDPGVATVDEDGTVTGKSEGEATVTVSTADGGKTASCAVTVNNPVTGVSLDRTEIMVKSNNSTAQLTATVLPTDATDKQVKWTSSNTDVATVSANGLVTGKAVGNATITVTADGNKTAHCAVTVYDYFAVSSESEWPEALTSISGAQGGTADSPNVFVIEVTGNVSVNGINSGSNITGDYKEVRLTGGSGTLSLSSPGSLIRTAANQTFVIDGPTLQGISGNAYNSLVYITGSSTVELRSGYIKDNVCNANQGGGVRVEGGDFIMSGGEITNNNSSAGGGVYVNSGNFTINSGKIIDNSSDTCGGVLVNSGTFTMNNGEISDNTSNNSGGGVYNSGNFTMNNGKISYNTSSGGGGVFVNSGNFTMNNGEISNNTASSAGGGVLAASGSFTMTGGFIYGQDNPDSSNNAGSGKAAFINDGVVGPIDNIVLPPNKCQLK